MCLPFIFRSGSAPNWCAQLVHTNFAWAELGLRAKGSPVGLAGDGLNDDGRQSDATHVQRQTEKSHLQRAYKCGFITQRELVAFLYSNSQVKKWKMNLRMMPGNLGVYSFPFCISITFECLKHIPLYWTEYSHCFYTINTTCYKYEKCMTLSQQLWWDQMNTSVLFPLQKTY